MSEIKDSYNTKYEKDDFFAYREWLFNPYITSLISIMGLKQEASILDVGCRQGFFSCLFRKSGMRVVGVDISETGIQMAQTNYGYLGIEFITGDIAEMPSSQFDCVFTRSCSIYNTDDFPMNHQFTERLLQFTKKGGFFIFSYNTNFSPKKKSQTWRYHTLNDVQQHFSSYPCKEIFFITKIDTVLIRKFAFKPSVTKLNIAFSKVFGVGGDIVCIIQK